MRTTQGYRDRRGAGVLLGRQVRELVGVAPDTVVLALPRGGAPVGLEVARALQAPLDVFTVRKLGAPGHEEYAIGAIAAGGFEVLNHEAIAGLQVSAQEIAEVVARESAELRRREALYRGTRAPVPVFGRTVVLVDDGLATGFSMRAAITAIRARSPQRIIVAVPVGAPDTCAALAREVDAVVCPLQPSHFQAVGLWYEHFEATTDDEVSACLTEAAALPRPGSPRGP